MLNRWSGIPFSALKGFRAPFLNITVDTLEILADQGFTYDSSFVSASPLESDDTDAFWPYTLDNGLANNCLTVEGACQGQPQLPGFWEIPMYSMFSNEGDGTAVTVMDPYLSSTDTDEVLDLMKANFQKHYDGNRQPFGLYMHPAHLVSGYPGVSE